MKLFLFASALVAVSCTPLGAVSPSLGGNNYRTGDNPLNGTPVQWSEEVRGVPLQGQRVCTRWPLQNSLQVRATDAQICVDGVLYRVLDANFPREDEELSIKTDEGYAAIEATPQKIGTCSDPPITKSIWATHFKNACVPNKDTAHGGGAILSRSSKQLTVGDATWTFSEAATTAPTNVPPSNPDNDAGAKYKADAAKCMNGQPIEPGSIVGAGTCKMLFQAAQSGDDSKLPRGAREAFREIRGGSP